MTGRSSIATSSKLSPGPNLTAKNQAKGHLVQQLRACIECKTVCWILISLHQLLLSVMGVSDAD